jgi:hypothetical protein
MAKVINASIMPVTDRVYWSHNSGKKNLNFVEVGK